MKPFRSPEEMLDAHEQMFGEAGRKCAEVVLHRARTLFAIPLDTLNIRVVLAPIELGPYGRHYGYCARPEESVFILGNRNIVVFDGRSLTLKEEGHPEFVTDYKDFLVHELTHVRQAQLEREHGWRRTRGAHRDRGWYAAVSEACPRYLGFELAEAIWPTGPRPKAGHLTEVEMTHWPNSIRDLAVDGDPRLPRDAGERVIEALYGKAA